MATLRQNVPSDFGAGGAGLTPGGSSVQQPTPANFGPGTIPVNPDLATILWAMLARHAPPMVNYAALQAFGATNLLDRQDGMFTLVMSDSSMWRWSATSVAAEAPTVVVPSDNPAAGRWLAIGSNAASNAVPTVAVDLKGAVLAAGTPLAAYAGSTPGITLDNSKAVAVRWHPGSLTAIWTEVDLPLDLDPTFPVNMVLQVSKSGATPTDVVSFTMTAFAQTVAALEDAGSNIGAVTPALTTPQASLPAKTITKLSATIFLPPTVPARLSISIVPSGTLATDDVIVNGFWLEYTKRPAVPRVLVDFRAAVLANGTPMAAWSNNAGASAPGVTLDNSKAVGCRWNNQATLTAIFSSCEMPLDMDVTKPCVIVVLASKSGATVGDATTFDVGLFQQIPGSLEDTTAGSLGLGGTTNALAGAATAKTVSKLTIGIAANTLVAAPGRLTVSIKPTDGTLGTDDAMLNGFWIEYTKKASGGPLHLPIDLKAAVLAAGTPMAQWVNGALSAPGVTVNNSKALGIRWNNAAAQVAVFSERDLPNDFDVTQPCTLVVQLSKSGATVTDLTSFDFALFQQAVGLAEDAGPTVAGTTSALTAAQAVLAAKTITRLTFTIPANTFSAALGRITASLKPTNGTLGTDDALCCGFWIEF